MNGDVLARAADIRALAASAADTMAVTEVADAASLGSVEVAGERVVRIHEKVANPPSKLANAGLYLLTPAIFKAIDQTAKSPRGEYELTDSLQLMIDSGIEVACYRLGYWLDLSYPWDILSANEVLLQKLEPACAGNLEPGVTIKGNVAVGRDTTIRSGSYLVGPIIIGNGCDIGPNCVVRPATTIGDRCRIGGGVEVKNSVVMDGTKIPHQSYVGDSVIGEGCNLGAGTRLANLRLDGKSVYVAGIDTGRRKLGAILGDNVETGVNACLNPGTVVGNGAHIGPGAVASGTIAPGCHIC